MNLLLHPAYFPNCLTMGALSQNNVVWEVWDNYQKQTFRNRCYIATDRGPLMLNIPIVHVGGETGRQAYREVRIENSYPWQRQHWRSLATAYRSAPFFEYFEEDLRPIFERPFTFLMDLNLESIAILCQLLELPIPSRQSEGYETTPDKIRDARHLIRAKEKNTIRLAEYPQVFQERHGFLENLSVLDLIFNEGPAALSYLKGIEFPKNA